MNEKKSNVYLQLLWIAVPISLQSLLSSGLGLVGNLMVSHLGDAQLSGVGLAGQFLGLYQLCALGIGLGAAVLTGRYWGMGDRLRLRQTTGVMLRVMVLFAGVFTLVAALFPQGIMGLYTKEGAVIDYGAAYLRWQVPSFVCVGLSAGCTAVLRSVGQVRLPLYGSVAALAVNGVFGWLLIFGWGAVPPLGVEGASLALLLARVVELAVISLGFFRRGGAGFSIRELAAPCKEQLRSYLQVAVPVVISNGLLGLGENVAAAVMGRVGQTFVAANSVASVMLLLSGVLTQGPAYAAGIIIGHTIGEGAGEKARELAKGFAYVGVAVGLVSAVLMLVLRDGVVSLYGVSSETAEAARSLINVMAAVVLFQAPGTMLSKGVLRAGGDTSFLMVTDGLLQWLAAVPLGLMAGFVWGLSPVWIYLLLRLDQPLRCVVCALRLAGGRWLKTLGGNA